MNELTELGIAGLSDLLDARDVSPCDIVEAFLARALRLDPALGAFMEITAERARAEAVAAEAAIASGHRRSKLHGIPFAVKDVIDVAGLRTTAGSRLLADNVAVRDAACVASMRDAGAILLGKCATYEFATGGPSFDLPWPATRNPWNLDHVPGGSSTGSAAAVSADMVPVALGTDTGGSVRVPAANCGLSGFKPGYGRIGMSGVVPLSPALDTLGVLARSAADCAIAFAALAGEPVKLRPGIKGLRIGFARNLHDGATAEVDAAMDVAAAALRDLGATVEPVALRPMADYGAAQRMIVLAEGFALHRSALAARPDAFGEVFRYRVLPGALVSVADLAAAQSLQVRLTGEMLRALDKVDVLLAAAALGAAPSFAETALGGRLRPFLTAPFSLARVPAIALCNGFDAARLPLSMQIAGRPGDEAAVLGVAHAYQQATDWHRKRPPPPLAPATSRTPPWQPADVPADAARDAYVDACLAAHGISLSELQLLQLREGAGSVMAMARRVRQSVASPGT